MGENANKRGGDVTKTKDGPNWKKIKAEYIRGGISQQKLADKYGVHRSTLQGRMQREDWNQLRNEASAKAGLKLVEKTAEKEALTKEALQSKLVDLKKEQMNQRFQLAAGQLPKTHVLRKTRREIARVKTKLNAAK